MGEGNDCSAPLKTPTPLDSRKRLPAMGAETMSRIPWPAASRAEGEGPSAKALANRLTAFFENSPATVAFQENLPPFDRNERNKKEAQIMIQTLPPGGGQAASRTGSRLVIDLDLLWLVSADEDESTPPAEPPAEPVPGISRKERGKKSRCPSGSFPAGVQTLFRGGKRWENFPSTVSPDFSLS